jgi:hypothetical protein
MLFLAFICVTAIFWAHTSHRSYLDVYWIVLASSVVEASDLLRSPGDVAQTPLKNPLAPHATTAPRGVGLGVGARRFRGSMP